MKDFFISYTSVDRAWAEWVAWELEEAEYDVVIQAWDSLPGSNFVTQMRLAAKDTRHTIAVLSRAYLRSLYAEAEWNAAFAKDPTGARRALIPVRIEPCEIRGLDAPIVYLDLVGLSEDAARAALLAGVSQSRAKPPTKPGFPGGRGEEKSSPPFPGTNGVLVPPREMHIGILSTEFVDLSAQKDLTYEANELVRELGAFGATTHLLDPTRLVLGVRDSVAHVGYASERLVNWEFFDALSVLIVRRTRADDPSITDMIYDLLVFLPRTHPKLLIFDRPEVFVRPLSKVPSMLMRAAAGLPQPDSVHVARSLADRITTFVDYPLVVKPSHGWRGIDVDECRDPAALTAYLRRVAEAAGHAHRFGVLLEKKLPIIEEYRVVVVGGEPLGCARKAEVPGRIARNRAQGSEWSAASDPEAMRLGTKAAEAHGYTFAGVDIAQLDEGYVVIECNRNPQFAGFDKATGESVAKAMARFAVEQLRSTTGEG
jgi:glutathione synthase/RimK-type ligase-like ATP-grasp enzyme